MTKQDIPQFQQAMKQLCVLFDKPFTPELGEIYFFALGELTIEQFTMAAMTIARSAKFFPKPVELRELVYGKAEARAENAWALFTEAVRIGGQMRSVYCADAAMATCIKRLFGGWSRACESLPVTEDPMFAATRKQFLQLYQVAVAEGSGDHYLIGRAEGENASGGGPMLQGRGDSYKQAVVMIGKDVKLRDADFSWQTGRLVDPDMLALPGMADDRPTLPGVSIGELTSKLSM